VVTLLLQLSLLLLQSLVAPRLENEIIESVRYNSR